MFDIRLGIPEMKALWDNLSKKVSGGSAKKDEEKQYRQLGKAMKLLAENPRYPGLHTHEIASLSARYGRKVWESYLENNTPKDGLLFWVYCKGTGEITVIGIEPHPDDKANAYRKITLSSLGEEIN